MVHTFELSKRISKDDYEEIISLLHMKWYKKKMCFVTRDYAEQGFQQICLREIEKEMHKGQTQNEDEEKAVMAMIVRNGWN